MFCKHKGQSKHPQKSAEAEEEIRLTTRAQSPMACGGFQSVRLSLRKRLNDSVPREKAQAAKARPLQKLLIRAEELEKAEKERKAQEARKKHIAEMKALAQREAQVWKQVDDLLENGRKIASVYDEATGLLEKLKQLADFQDTRDTFFSNVRVLASKYGSRSSLMDRWKKRGWL